VVRVNGQKIKNPAYSPHTKVEIWAKDPKPFYNPKFHHCKKKITKKLSQDEEVPLRW
jgi:ribosomal protein S4